MHAKVILNSFNLNSFPIDITKSYIPFLCSLVSTEGKYTNKPKDNPSPSVATNSTSDGMYYMHTNIILMRMDRCVLHRLY